MFTIDFVQETATQLVKSLNRVTGLPFILCRDKKYRALERGESPLCRLLQENREGRNLCERECTASLYKAARDGKPFYFQCYAYLNNVAIPIGSDGEIHYFVVGGRIIKSYNDLVNFRIIAEKLGCKENHITSVIENVSIHNLEDFKAQIDAFRFTPSGISTGSENARIRLLEETLNKLNSIIRIASGIGDIKDDNEFYKTIVDTIGILFNVRTVLLFMREGNIFTLREGFGTHTEKYKDLLLDIEKGLIGEVVKKNQIITSCDLVDILRAGFPGGITSVVLFPIIVRKKVEGLVGILNTPLSREDRNLIASFLKSISLSIENRLLAEWRELFTRKGMSAIEAIHNITNHIDSPDLFRIIVEESARIIGAEKGSLMLLDNGGNYLRVKAAKGLNSLITEHVVIDAGEGISGYVAKRGVPLIVTDIERDRRFARPNRTRYRTKSFISLPLKIKDRTIGVLNFADKTDNRAFSMKDLSILEAIALYSSVAIERRNYYQSSLNLKKISITDPLTGLLNRRYFEERIAEEMERSRRHKEPFSLIIMDIDNFKDFNDSYGHLAGDEALRCTGHTVRKSIRIIDIAARYGGEEFAIILPTTGKEDAIIIGERIRDEVEKMCFYVKEKTLIAHLTVSIGIATFPDDASGLEDLIDKADKALYTAKRKGKNRVEIYTSYLDK